MLATVEHDRYGVASGETRTRSLLRNALWIRQAAGTTTNISIRTRTKYSEVRVEGAHDDACVRGAFEVKTYEVAAIERHDVVTQTPQLDNDRFRQVFVGVEPRHRQATSWASISSSISVGWSCAYAHLDSKPFDRLVVMSFGDPDVLRPKIAALGFPSNRVTWL